MGRKAKVVFQFIPNINPLALSVKEIHVKLNILPRDWAVILDRSQHGNSLTRFRVPKCQLAFRDDDLVFIKLEVLALIKQAGGENHHDKHRKHREHDARMVEKLGQPILKGVAVGTFPRLLRNLHATHLADLHVRMRIHKQNNLN